MLLDITEYYEYYSVLPILHNITNPIFIDVSQYYISNFTQYYIGGIQYEHYSILLNSPKLQNCFFQFNMSILLNIANLPPISNIHQ